MDQTPHAPSRSFTLAGKTANVNFTLPGNWRPLQILGSGSYATVASFDADGRELAVKKVEGIFAHPVLALRTLREVKLLAHLQHPNILCLHELYLDGPSFKDAYLCLERMDGDLHLLIHGTKNYLSDHQVQCVLYQMLRGLLCLRCAKVIHRDLKPGNVLVRSGGEVKIGDLGLARGIDSDEDGHDELMLTEYVVTRYYRAPEVVLTASKYTYAVDMWSTGCILGEMLTRRPIFEGKDSLDQVKKIIGVLGCQAHEDLAWIPASSSAQKFVQMCNKSVPPTDQGLLNLTKRRSGPPTNPLAVDMLVQMLRFDPSRRVGVEDALEHRFLKQFVPAEDAEVASARNTPSMDWTFDASLCFDRTSGRPKPFQVDEFRRTFVEAREELRRPGAQIMSSRHLNFDASWRD